MKSIERNIYIYCRSVTICLITVVTASLLTGCQNIFHAQEGALKGKSVTVSVTVPENPLPAVQPLQHVPVVNPPASKRPLDGRLLPTQPPSESEQLVTKNPAGMTLVSRHKKPARMVAKKADTILAGKTVTEDMVLRGSVLIKGSLVIAPQATLRIEPGSVIRFVPVEGSGLLSRLVVQGRIVVLGTVQQPVLFASGFSDTIAGDWGGLVLLNSEKKNNLDHCRIEGAQTGLEAHFSRFSGRDLSISKSLTAVALFDSEASLQSSSFTRCDVALRLADSELDLRDSTVQENRQGLLGHHSSFTFNSVKVLNNAQEGIAAEQCRFRLTSSLFAENRTGIRLNGGDGQVLLCRFYQNRENGAELLGTRIRIKTSSFIQNTGTGILLENARGTVVGSSFGKNRGGDLQNRGNEFFAALLNWWDTIDEKRIAAGILDPTRKEHEGTVLFMPFLQERPAIVP
jgi:hypothetical protein